MFCGVSGSSGIGCQKNSIFVFMAATLLPHPPISTLHIPKLSFKQKVQNRWYFFKEDIRDGIYNIKQFIIKKLES